MSFDLGKAIGVIAPTLSTMLLGPLAGTAVKALTDAFGLSSSGDTAQDSAAITKVIQDGGMTPEIIAAVRAADQKHAEIMGQQGIDLAKINAAHAEAQDRAEVDDRNGARQREMTVKDGTPANLAYIIILGFFVTSIAQITFMLLWPERASLVPSTAWALIGSVSGYLANEAKQAAAYYFGSTIGSKAKDATIDKALNS